MSQEPARPTPVRFGTFEARPETGELLRDGASVAVQELPFQVLCALLERPGAVVSREQLKQRLWADQEYGDLDHGLNKAVNKLREALGDSASEPQFIETLPRRGYRFIGAVESVGTSPRPASEAAAVPRGGGGLRGALLAVLTLAAVIVGALALRPDRETVPAEAVSEAERRMLLVLPLDAFGDESDPGSGWFAQGLTEELTTRLSRVQPERLGVIARTTATQAKEGGWSLEEMRERLGVDFVLEGSVRRFKGEVLITVQLIETEAMSHLWSQEYPGTLLDVFSFQADVGGRVADSLRLELLPGEGRGAPAPTASAEAYSAYLEGRFYWNQRTEAGLRRSRDLFEKATTLDPDYALAWAGLADAYNMLSDYGAVAPIEALPEAIEASRRALSIEPELVEAQTALTWAQWTWYGNFEEAEPGFLRALDLDPNYAPVHQLFAHALRSQMRGVDAMRAARVARDLDPYSLILNAIVAWHHYLDREPELALEQARSTIDLDPEFARVHSYLGWALLMQGQIDEAVEEIELARELFGRENLSRKAEVAHAYAVAGRRDEATRLLAELEEAADRRWVEPVLIAKVHLGLGDHEQALRWMESSFEHRSPHRLLIAADPQLDALRSEPRFQALVEQVVPRGP